MSLWLLVNVLSFLVYTIDAYAIGSTSGCCNNYTVIEPVPHLRVYKRYDSYYHFGTLYKGNFYKSLQYCQFHGMGLVSIETAEENIFLQSIVQQIFDDKGEYHFWSSGSILPDGAGNPFVWLSTGLPVTYTNWAPNQPDNFANSEKCLEVVYNPKTSSSLMWNDLNCDSTNYPICETNSIKAVIDAVSKEAEKSCNSTFTAIGYQ